VTYYHLDGLGNVRAMTDKNAAIVERHDYLPFGEECTTAPCTPAGGAQPKRFTGKERDTETGLDYFGARHYGASLGRFTTVDPTVNVQRGLVDPQRWNRYAYGLSNPFRYVDPDGRDVSIGLTFTGNDWTAEEKTAIIGRVTDWYQGQDVGNVYVFDSATNAHGSWSSCCLSRYANLEVSSESSTKHDPHKVFAGNYRHLPTEKRRTATANTIVHETAAHQFHATYANFMDQVNYSREAAEHDSMIRSRFGTVADSYAYGEERTRHSVTDGPIPIHPDDHKLLLELVGPSVHVSPPVPR
jgi:RHS repeat-associated protein